MKIKRFIEALEDSKEISPERIDEIVSELTTITTDLDASKEKIESFANELSNYVSKSKNSNDQIDDSVINLNSVKSNFDEIVSSLDTIVNNLKDYKDKGRNFLY